MAESRVSGTFAFRGMDYVITLTTENNSRIVLQVEDRLTADQWRAHFDAAAIEELTHKTGNYKQFSVFVNMLESAISRRGESVSLDLLTFADLESLRNRKTGATSSIPPASRNTSNSSKRYLILTYTVEFDRIHYPLPLPYMGKPDPSSLQDTMRTLQNELHTLKRQTSKSHMQKELEKLKRDYDLLLQEKEDIEAAFVDFRREVQLTTVGSATKEIRMLKEVVKNLEEDLLKEKTKHQRAASRRSQEHRALLEELDEVKASDRTLRARVKSLTNELAMHKRRATGTRPGSGRSSQHAPSINNGYSSRENSLTRDNSRLSRLSNNSYKSRNRSLERSRERTLSRERERLRDKPVYVRGRLPSREVSLRDRSSSRERSLSRERGGGSMDRNRANISEGSAGSGRSRGSSIASGSGYPRFDPTGYVKEQQQRKKENTRKVRRPPTRLSGSFERKQHRNLSDGALPRISRSRTSSISSLRSQRSSLDSMDSDCGGASDASEGPLRKTKKILKTVRSINAWSSPDASFNSKGSGKPPMKVKKPHRVMSSTPESKRTRSRIRRKENIPSDGGDSDYFNRSSEIGEIDARLNRLQEFMKNNL